MQELEAPHLASLCEPDMSGQTVINQRIGMKPLEVV